MTLLAEAPAGRHFAQFHRDADSLRESVFTFLEAGLRRGDGVLVVATPETRDGLETRLSRHNLDPKALNDSGQLDMLDAATLTADVTPRGVPESPRFRNALVPVLSRVRASDRGVRIFSEMASLLWNDGNTEGATRLEELWNGLARIHTFSLYCGYTLDTQCERSYAGPLEDLGHAHTDILGTEEDERFGLALDRASKEIFGISLSQMAGITTHDGTRRFPSGQRTMLWVKRNLPLSTAQLAERARRYFQESVPSLH
ncbi:MAG TPA: MEDS domain-containing protein [Gemmatimonadales bacterium]|nr:MEDS domain-containing protein [Gemmatimonadales bacterium]